jgi:hypothetical protein
MKDFQTVPYEELCGCVSALIPSALEHKWKDNQPNHEATKQLLNSTKGQRIVDADCLICKGTGIKQEAT